MQLTLVGPTHPYKGGVAQHTTTLAHQLAAAGHRVNLVSWSAQYPSALYPGVQRVSRLARTWIAAPSGPPHNRSGLCKTPARGQTSP